jgi:hypothetical protein
MLLSNPLIVIATFFSLFGLIFLILALVGIKKRKLITTGAIFVTVFLMLSLSAIFVAVSIATQGYRTLTGEELAATIKIEPIGEQKFNARFSMPNGNEKVFSLAGDQLSVKAHILRWKPLVSLFGPQTSYELDQVAGRYALLNTETAKAPALYSLSYEKPLNMFDLRQRFAMLAPFLDAESASAALNNANSTEEFRVMVSAAGVLIRKKNKEPDR